MEDQTQDLTKDPTPTKDPARVTKPKLEPKSKNPKRVEQGKRLAAHNKKMKKPLSKGLIESSYVEDTTEKTEQLIPEWTLKWGDLAIGVGIWILFFKWWIK